MKTGKALHWPRSLASLGSSKGILNIPKRLHPCLLALRLRLDAKLAEYEPERGDIVPARFARDTEVDEENNSAGRGEPAVELVRNDRRVARAPDDRGDLLDAPKVEVRVGPAAPGPEWLRRDVEVDAIAGDGNEEQKRGRGEGHEPEVAAEREGGLLG